MIKELGPSGRRRRGSFRQGTGPRVWDEEEETEGELDKRKIPSRHKKPEPHPTRSGMVECLRCGKRFESWDRTRNRICPSCSGRHY
jgi:hypothetical protein